MNFSSMYVLVSVIYGLPSVFLYLFSYFIIITHRKSFDSSFFNLYIYDGLFNLFTYFNGFIFLRLSNITCYNCFFASFFKNTDGIILKFIICMTWHMAYVQYGTTVLISLNRLSVLLKYHVLEPIWRKYTWILIIFVYFLPFLDTYHYFIHTAKMIYFEEREGYSPVSSRPVKESFTFLIPFMIISTVCSVVVNITSILFVKRVKLQKKNKIESNFLIIMSITCTAQLFGMILSVSKVILAGTNLANGFTRILPFVSDGLTLIQPWLLIVFCHSIREKMKIMFGWKLKTKTVSSQMFQVRTITN